MVDDIKFEDLPKVMESYAKTRTYIDVVNMKNQKDLDLFRKKLQFNMPQVPLKDVPKDAEPQERNPNPPPVFRGHNRRRRRRNQKLLPLFNRLQRYRGHNTRKRRRNPEQVEDERMEEDRVEK